MACPREFTALGRATFFIGNNNIINFFLRQETFRMKKALLLLFLLPTLLYAQYNGSGYYRISNYSSGRDIWVVDFTGGIIGTSADSHAIQLRNNKVEALSSPKSVIYIDDLGNKLFNISAQGTSVHDILGYWVSVNVKDQARGIMTVEATKGGLNFSLGDEGVDNGLGYTSLTIYGKSSNNRWVATPISSSTDNYFGVKPTIKSGNKYYAPFYADFAFKFASSGMKAYTVSAVDNAISAAVIKEITTDIIPARTPVLIECNSDDVSKNRLDIFKSANSPIAENKLAGNFFNYDEVKDYTQRPGAITAFDANTMRVFNVNEKGELILSTDQSLLYKDQFGRYANTRFLQPNSAYLPVSNDTPNELRIITAEEYKEYKDKIEGEKAKEENNAAYQRLSGELNDLKQVYQVTAKKITSECPNVASKYEAQLAEVQAMINASQEDLEQKNKAILLNAESTLSNSQEIKQALEVILVSAQKAQKEYEAEQEAIRQQQIEANDAAYAKLSDELNKVKESLLETQDFIKNQCPLVASSFDSKLSSIQESINRIQTELKQKHLNIQLTAESTIDTATILAAIQDVRNQAIEAQKKAIEEQQELESKKQANDEAFARLGAILQQLKDEFSAAQTRIAAECPLVAETYQTSMEEINQKIAGQEQWLREMHAAIALNAESTLETVPLAQMIESIVQQAIAAQKAAEEKLQEEQAQKIAANEEAYNRLNVKFAQVKSALEHASETIQKECPLAAENYMPKIKELSEVLASRMNEVAMLYEACALNADSDVMIEDILDMIEKTVEEAKIAQDKALGIELTNVDPKRSAIYNMQGVKVSGKKLSKGLYIVNGKKLMIK